MKVQAGIAAAVLAGAGYLALTRLRRRTPIDLRRKVVLITGGSRGLGLETAREFGSHGAIVAICARDESELNRAQADLQARGVEAQSFVCDIADREQVSAMVNSVAERRQGSIVNITSVGGKVSIPHLLPYCCAKFAATALSEGLRAELEPEGIRVQQLYPVFSAPAPI